ncbi:MAG TPA: lipid II flippase MurJ [Candidatus Paceibacterota bacterium]|nr:lipid II flippase MurJ [Candidatus Paceibacterota bacterium]
MTRLVTGEIRGMHAAAYLLAAFTILSSLLGFLRDRLLAHAFGAGHALDLYNAAFSIPDFIFVTVASLVSAYVLIPEFMRRAEGERTAYIETIMLWFAALIAAVGIGAYIAAPFLLSRFFPALWNGPDSGLLLVMTRIMLLQPVFLGCSNILATITQSRNRYVIYALSPLFYNFGIILGVVALYPVFGLPGLAWGVVLGAVLHVSVPLPSILADGFFLRMRRIGPAREFFRTILISLPRTLALSANQIVYLAMLSIASGLAVGSIAVFRFAFNLQAAAASVVGVSYSVAAFPALAGLFSAGKHGEFVRQVRQATQHVIFWTFPMTALVIVLRAHVVRVILGSGAFDWTATRLTAAAFALFALALAANALMPLFARAYYAAGRSWMPFAVNAVAAIGSVAAAVWLSHALASGGAARDVLETVLRVTGVPGTEVLALPLSYAAGSLAATIAMAAFMERDFGGFLHGVARTAGQALVASAAGAAATYGMLDALGGISDLSTLISVLATGFIAGLSGLLVTALAYMLLGSQELAEVYRALSTRVTPLRSRVVVSAEDELA